MDRSTPRNLQDLLKFAVKQQDREKNDMSEIDEEKRQFLDNVIQSMSVNVIEEFLQAIEVLQTNISSDDDKCNALNLIRDYIDNIDFANSFVKIEGADILINCLTSEKKIVQVNTINLIAEMTQNNPFCQQYFSEKGVIKLLVQFLNVDDFDILACALYAISCIVRNFEPALAELQNEGGLKCIVNCFTKANERVFVKACFLLACISSEFNLIRDEFVRIGAFNLLWKKLNVIDDYDVQIEMLLLAMSVLVKSSHCNPNQEEKSHILSILNTIVDRTKNLPQCQEIVSYANSILHDVK